MYELQKKIPWIVSVKVNRRREARLGADMEWWFLNGSGGGIGVYVQAKNIITGNNYPSLNYSNAHGLQIDTLMKNAARDNRLALYAFYSSISYNCSGIPCYINQLLGRRRSNPPGVFIAPADVIYNQFIQNGPGMAIGRDVLQHARDFTCLFCCTAGLPSDVAARERNYENLFDHIARFFDPESVTPQTAERHGFHFRVPQYVDELRQSKSSLNVDPAEIGSRVADQLAENVEGIVVFDLSEQP